MTLSLVSRVFHLLMKDPGNEVDRTPCNVGLHAKIPKNNLKIYSDSPAKSSINLYFLSTNLTNLSKNPNKSHNFVDEYLTANTLLSAKT